MERLEKIIDYFDKTRCEENIISFVNRTINDLLKTQIRIIIFKERDIQPAHGAFVYLNEKYKEKKLENFYEISFRMYYPKIMVYLERRNIIQFNIEGFAELFAFMVDNYDNLIKIPGNHEAKLKYKRFINCVYGASISDRCILSCFKHHEISKHCHKIMKDITAEIVNVIYSDTDKIYLEQYLSEYDKFFIDIHKTYNIVNEIEQCRNGIFYRKKQYCVDGKTIGILKTKHMGGVDKLLKKRNLKNS